MKSNIIRNVCAYVDDIEKNVIYIYIYIEPSPLKVSPKTKINYFYTILCISMRIAVK